MNCIIIEDDPLSIRIIEEFVSRTDELDLLASFGSAVDAINYFQRENDVDLVFPSLENHTTISLQKYTTLMQG